MTIETAAEAVKLMERRNKITSEINSVRNCDSICGFYERETPNAINHNLSAEEKQFRKDIAIELKEAVNNILERRLAEIEQRINELS